MPEVGVDETVTFGRVLVGLGPGDPRRVTRLACLLAGTPDRRRLRDPQRAIADGKESGRRHREQACAGDRWHQAARSGSRQEPEAQSDRRALLPGKTVLEVTADSASRTPAPRPGHAQAHQVGVLLTTDPSAPLKASSFLNCPARGASSPLPGTLAAQRAQGPLPGVLRRLTEPRDRQLDMVVQLASERRRSPAHTSCVRR